MKVYFVNEAETRRVGWEPGAMSLSLWMLVQDVWVEASTYAKAGWTRTAPDLRTAYRVALNVMTDERVWKMAREDMEKQ